MFCNKCGSDLPDDSQFCRKCGQALGSKSVSTGGGTAAAPATEAIKSKSPVRASLVFAALLIVALLWRIDHVRQQENANSRPTAPAPQLHRVTIGNGAVTVSAASATYFTLPVPAEANNVKVQGHFTATGGSGNDIEVYLLNQDEYTNWQNHHATSTYYNSGKVTAGEVNAMLPNDAGMYYLVFNNKFSLLSPKAVEENFTLTYYQ